MGYNSDFQWIPLEDFTDHDKTLVVRPAGGEPIAADVISFSHNVINIAPWAIPRPGSPRSWTPWPAYVASLTSVRRSPYRTPDGSFTAEGFVLHDVGTLKASSGRRLNQELPGLDTPTLPGLWETAPYLHDGSATTLLDVLTTANP